MPIPLFWYMENRFGFYPIKICSNTYGNYWENKANNMYVEAEDIRDQMWSSEGSS